jgi:hypothetical protein
MSTGIRSGDQQTDAKEQCQDAPTSLESAISAHPDDDCLLEYTKALVKGKTLHSQVYADKPTIPASVFRSSTDLEDWGYLLNMKPDSRRINLVDFWTEHTTHTTREGVAYPATNAIFGNTISIDIGTIIATCNYAPHETTKRMCLAALVLPKLCHWSDVAYLQWLHATRDHTPIPVLRTVVHDHVVNRAVGMVMKHILSKLPSGNYRDGRFLKYTFSADSQDGLAILGTPIGAGVAYLLIQHREELGHRVIDKIEVYQTPSGKYWQYMQLVFHIKEADEVNI